MSFRSRAYFWIVVGLVGAILFGFGMSIFNSHEPPLFPFLGEYERFAATIAVPVGIVMGIMCVVYYGRVADEMLKERKERGEHIGYRLNSRQRYQYIASAMLLYLGINFLEPYFGLRQNSISRHFTPYEIPIGVVILIASLAMFFWVGRNIRQSIRSQRAN